MGDGDRAALQYDAMAAAYAEDSAGNAYNAHYERPATIALLGEVTARRVLEVGCGAGPLTAWLVDQGGRGDRHGRQPRDAAPGPRPTR